MTNVKALRKKNAEFLAQLTIDQTFYASRIKEYDEEGLRGKSGKLTKELAEEKKKVEGKLMGKDNKSRPPTPEDLKEFKRIEVEVKSVQAIINEFEELKQGKVKGLKALKDVKSIIEIIDNLSSPEKYKLNHL